MTKFFKNCKKGYGCGGSCISVSYVCSKDFPKGVSVALDGAEKAIYDLNAPRVNKDSLLADDSKTIKSKAASKLGRLEAELAKAQADTTTKAKAEADTKAKAKAKAAEEKAKADAKTKAEADAKAKAKADTDKVKAKKDQTEILNNVAKIDLKADPQKTLDDIKKIQKQVDDSNIDSKAKDALKSQLSQIRKIIEPRAAAKEAADLEASLKSAKAQAQAKKTTTKPKETTAEPEKVTATTKAGTEANEADRQALRDKYSKVVEEYEKGSSKIEKNEYKLAKNITNAARPEDYERLYKEREELKASLYTPEGRVRLSGADAIVKQSILKSDQMLQAYYGEPTKVRDLPVKSDRPPVDKIIPKKLPRSKGDTADEEALKFVDNAEVLIQVKPEGLAGILKDGRFKSGFEKGTSGTGDHDDETIRDDYYRQRSTAESSVMGVSRGTDATKRPIYGYLEHPDRALSRRDTLDMYGDIQIVLKDEVKNRSTMTVGDSLDDIDTREKATPVRAPSVKHRAGLETNNWTRSGGGKVSYIETQIHNGVSVSDIQKVRVSRDKLSPELEKQLKDRNIGIEFIKPQSELL